MALVTAEVDKLLRELGQRPTHVTQARRVYDEAQMLIFMKPVEVLVEPAATRVPRGRGDLLGPLLLPELLEVNRCQIGQDETSLAHPTMDERERGPAPFSVGCA
jgi:hypothetical protein